MACLPKANWCGVAEYGHIIMLVWKTWNRRRFAFCAMSSLEKKKKKKSMVNVVLPSPVYMSGAVFHWFLNDEALYYNHLYIDKALEWRVIAVIVESVNLSDLIMMIVIEQHRFTMTLVQRIRVFGNLLWFNRWVLSTWHLMKLLLMCDLRCIVR